MNDHISIRGARQNNLKGIDLDLPKRTLTVVTGLSGTGKSSLVFDTIFAEGQRRYMESLSTYAKQFLEKLERPDYDVLEGISPTIAIEQKNPVKTARSTVGTMTEVYDFLRLLFARVGDTTCPGCGKLIVPDTVGGIADELLSFVPDTRILVTFPLRVSGEQTWETLAESLVAQGFMRVVLGGRVLRLDADGTHELEEGMRVLVVVDRIRVDSRRRSRLVDSIETAMMEGEGELVIRVPSERGPGDSRKRRAAGLPRLTRAMRTRGWSDDETCLEKQFTEHYRCPDCQEEFLQPTPLLFSFNNPYGACPSCRGFGNRLVYDENLIVPNDRLTIEEGAVDPWTKPIYEWWWDDLLEECREAGIPVDVPWGELPEKDRRTILYGRDRIDGVVPFLEDRERKKYKKHVRFFLRRYQSLKDCPLCHGGRLRPEALNVGIAGKTIVEISAMTIDDARRFLRSTRFTKQKKKVSRRILKEVASRLDFLHNVGVGYLTIDRLTRTLSGGEAQRINLASALGNQLIDAVYVLDEPTIGLHPRDTAKLVKIMENLRKNGNTLLVVEHDGDVMKAADHLVELGPEPGERGGSVIYQGDLSGLREADTPTGRYLSGDVPGVVKKRREPHEGFSVSLRGATLHNLKNIDVEFPLGLLVAVTGVSGAGKSTLVHDILYTNLQRIIAYGSEREDENLDAIDGVENLHRVVLVDQSPIGKSPRSNPVSYVKAFGSIRELFAQTPLARKRRYKPGRFSFNVKGGRCEACRGEGFQKIEMHFMADVFVRCEECRGTRFRKETLEITYRKKNIAQVLDMTVDEAIRFFEGEEEVGRGLWYLSAVGLGYLKLGQPATTLSGGEAQRVKIARELAGVPRREKMKRRRSRIPVTMTEAARRPHGALYILDEPTTGLHSQDIRRLLSVLGRLVDAGNTVLVIEHNPDVVKSADWVIDLGPEGGERGGEVVASGTPEKVARANGSHTGRWLRKSLGKRR